MSNEKKIKNPRLKSELIKISNIIPAVKQNLGLDKNLKITALKEIWPLVTTFETAKYSQPAYFDKENNLVIAVNNSALATELSMQKISILTRLKKAIKNTDINFKTVRFVIKSTSPVS